jgi:hypothetical protein
MIALGIGLEEYEYPYPVLGGAFAFPREFWANPAAAGATLPEGLTADPDSNGHGIAMFIDWQYNASRDEYLDPVRSQYHEFFVLMDARWQDTPVSWCPYIYVDNDHAMARGWIQGFPKKLGASASTAGYRLAAGEQDNPAVHELVMAVFDDATITDAWTGTSELEFPEAPGEELHDLAPVRTGAGYRYELSYTVTDLRTL